MKTQLILSYAENIHFKDTDYMPSHAGPKAVAVR
jgi:hypothetical protein